MKIKPNLEPQSINRILTDFVGPKRLLNVGGVSFLLVRHNEE